MDKPSDKIEKSEEAWRAELTPEQFYVCRMKGTERAFTGALWDEHRPGSYACVACGQALFRSDAKFESGSGWPSFCSVVTEGAISQHSDTSHGMRRVEITCSRCGSHLGHVFPDGPPPTGLRFCTNSAALRFTPDE